MPAIQQIEYLANTDGKLKDMCSEKCLMHLETDELTPIEQQCLKQCNKKLNVFYGYFYAQHGEHQRTLIESIINKNQFEETT